MSGTAGTGGLEVRPFRPDDEPQVLELLRRSLGGGPLGARTPDLFDWKHRRGPFGPSLLLVGERRGRVVGLRALMRWRLRSAGATVRAVRAVDTATDLGHRRLGVFSTLTEAALESLRGEVDLIFNTPNACSLPGYLRLGWRRVGSPRPGVRPRSPLRLAARIGSLRAPGGPPLAWGRPPDAAADVLADETAISAAIAQVERPPGRLATDYDPAFLRWRYAQAPGLDYRALLAEEEGERGLAVFRLRRRGRLTELCLCELLVPPGRVGMGRRLLREVAGASPADHLVCLLAAGTSAAQAAWRSGFLPVPGGPTLVVRPFEPVEPDPRELRSWALTLGDLEVF